MMIMDLFYGSYPLRGIAQKYREQPIPHIPSPRGLTALIISLHEIKFWGLAYQNHDMIMRHAVLGGSGLILTNYGSLTCTQI